jgi:hypothetical protein
MIGCYHLEFITADGERGSMSPELLGLPIGATQFRGHEPSRRHRRDGAGVYQRIILAMRGRYGALPTYREAFALYLAHARAS